MRLRSVFKMRTSILNTATTEQMGCIISVSYTHLDVYKRQSWYHIMQTARTFILVNIGMLIFRARNLNVAIAMLCSVFRPWNSKVSFWQIAFDQGGLFKLDFLLIVFSIILLYLIGKSQEEGHSIRELISKPVSYTHLDVYKRQV